VDMARRYRQLSLEERDRITEMMAGGMSLREVAAASFLSRESGFPPYGSWPTGHRPEFILESFLTPPPC